MIKSGIGAIVVMITGIFSFLLIGFPASADDGGKNGKWKRGGGYQISFAELDSDSDGMITAEDIEAYQVARFNNIDTDGDGMISLAEWETNFAEGASERKKSRIAKMFDKIDENGDEMISSEELPNKRMNFDRILDKLDQDGDGAISEEEFNEGKSKGRDGKRKSGKGDK